MSIVLLFLGQDTGLTNFLHGFAHQNVSGKVLGDTTVNTERLVGGQVGVGVVLVETLAVTRVQELVEHGGDHIQLSLSSCNLLLRRELWGRRTKT